MKRRNAVSQAGFALAVGLFIALLSAPAWSQGFMVKPMKIAFAPRAGATVTKVLELRNTGDDAPRTLDLRLVELTQGADGGWKIIDPDSDVDTSKLSSSLKWVKLSADSVDVKPLEMEPVTISVTVPRNARGYYLCGVIAQTRPPKDVKGIAIVIRFLVPILVDIQGRPVRQKIELSDVGMTHKEATQQTPPTTLINLGISNKGRTYSRIKGRVKLEYLSKDRWRPVSRTEYKEMGILPGVMLSLDSDINKRLPTGKYRLSGLLYVDGRRVKPLVKEIDFTGDPEVTKLAIDTALILEPPQVDLKCVPGSTRTAVIKIENASEDAVTIQATAIIPPSLKGVALGEFKGVDLSAAGWVRVSPAQFTLRGGRKQNVRVIAKMPKDGTTRSNYYGLLVLNAAYPDGQSAGKTTSLVAIANSRVEPAPAAQIDELTLAAGDADAYIIRTKAANIGSVHFLPKCRATLLGGMGQSVGQAVLSGEPGIMLPLQFRTFSGEMDFKDVEVGAYQLKASLDFAPGKAAIKQILLRVTVEDGKKVVTLVEAEKKDEPKPATAPAGTSPPGGDE